MRLHEIIADKPGARKKRKRLGRGRSSGHGKTSGRGHKGQKSRSGGSIPVGFEGGRIPLYRTLPHRGFNNARYRIEYAIVNLGELDSLDVDSPINRSLLIKKGLIRSNAKRLKILGKGELTKPISITADRFSTTAKEKIEAAGGQALSTSSTKDETVEKNDNSANSQQPKGNNQ